MYTEPLRIGALLQCQPKIKKRVVGDNTGRADLAFLKGDISAPLSGNWETTSDNTSRTLCRNINVIFFKILSLAILTPTKLKMKR